MSTRDSEEAKGPPVVGQRFRHKHVGPMAYFLRSATPHQSPVW